MTRWWWWSWRCCRAGGVTGTVHSWRRKHRTNVHLPVDWDWVWKRYLFVLDVGLDLGSSVVGQVVHLAQVASNVVDSDGMLTFGVIAHGNIEERSI